MVIEMKMKEAPVLGAKGSKKESNVLKNAEWAKKAVPFLGLLVLVLLFSTTTDGRFLKVTNLQNIFPRRQSSWLPVPAALLLCPIIIWIFPWEAHAP